MSTHGKLKVRRGNVSFYFVSCGHASQNIMSKSTAETIIKNGTVTENKRFPRHYICVNQTYYFEAR